MKKLLVVLMAAIMVLSLAAVSMAATVKGDFRYDMYQDEAQTDESFAISDLRVNVSGDISDTVSATAVFQLLHGKAGQAQGALQAFNTNEYYVTYKESWGGVKAGFYEYKFTPSRALLKAGHYHVWKKVDVMAATTFNLPVEGLTVDLLLQPYQQEGADDGAYGLTVDYKADSFGLKVSYADFLLPDSKVIAANAKDDANLMAIDAYYNITDNMKAFLCAVDYSSNDKDNAGVTDSVYQKNGIDGIDPVLGFSWNKIAGTGLFAAVEYAINERFEDNNASAYNEYTVQVKYAFTNKVGLEIEHYRQAKDSDKTIYRLRYQF